MWCKGFVVFAISFLCYLEFPLFLHSFQSDAKDGAIVTPATAQELEITSDLLKLASPALLAGFIYLFIQLSFYLIHVFISLFSFSLALTSRKIFAGGEYLTQALRAEQANDSRDALAKALYSRLFLWLVSRINSSIHLVPSSSSLSTLSITINIRIQTSFFSLSFYFYF
jgi:hypothetical protein